jgi:NitT/TauT family transport system substrate-binding protein
MHKNNTALILAIVISILFSLAGCTSQPIENPAEKAASPGISEVQLINPLGPAVIPVAGISSQNIKGDIAIQIQYWKTVDEAIGLLSGDQAEFAVLPITTGVNMAASGIDIVLVAVHEWKVFYLIASNNSEFSGWNSMIGKTIYTPEAKGQTVDVLTRYALLRESIEPDQDVTFSYAPAQEIAALFKEGKIEYAALPEPYVTLALASGAGKVALDYQDYWSQVSGAKDGIPIAGLFVKRDFLENHPLETQTIAQTLSASTAWANEDVSAAIQASGDILPLPAEVMQAAMQRVKFEYIPAAETKEEVINFLKTMQEIYPQGIKKIPGEEFFAK